MAVVLGLLVAVTYGTADYLGGKAARTTAWGATMLGSQSSGLVVSLVLALALGASHVTARDLAFGVAAGICAFAGIACLYRGLALGRAAVVSPIAAVGGAVIQITWGLATGERPSALAIVGIVLALAAVAVVAGTAGHGEEPDRHGRMPAPRQVELGFAAGAAVGLGLVLVLYNETGPDSGMWPVAVSRVLPVLALGVVLSARRAPRRPAPGDARWVLGAGALDASANALLLLAVRHDLLTLVAPAAALYPAATIVLAGAIDHERLGRARVAGLVVALVGLALIGTG